jgi:hypothetical protein
MFSPLDRIFSRLVGSCISDSLGLGRMLVHIYMLRFLPCFHLLMLGFLFCFVCAIFSAEILIENEAKNLCLARGERCKITGFCKTINFLATELLMPDSVLAERTRIAYPSREYMEI